MFAVALQGFSVIFINGAALNYSIRHIKMPNTNRKYPSTPLTLTGIQAVINNPLLAPEFDFYRLRSLVTFWHCLGHAILKYLINLEGIRPREKSFAWS
jgi:hypothetical protein